MIDSILKTMESVRLTLEETVSNEKLEEFDNAVQNIKALKPRMAVFMDGGLIQEMYSDSPVEVMKIDLDTDGAEEEDLTPYPDRKGSMNKAYIAQEEPEIDTDFINALWNNLNKED